MSSEMSLNANANSFTPSVINATNLGISKSILHMSYEEFQKGIENGRLPTIVPSQEPFISRVVLKRDTNDPYRSYGGWYDTERERMDMFDSNKFFDSSLDSVVASPINQWIDYRLKELYELQEQQWMSQHLDIFMDREPVLW